MDTKERMQTAREEKERLQGEVKSWLSRAADANAEVEKYRLQRLDLLRQRAEGGKVESDLDKAEKVLSSLLRTSESIGAKLDEVRILQDAADAEFEAAKKADEGRCRAERWAQNETECEELQSALDSALRELTARIIAAGETYAMVLAIRQRFVEKGGDLFRKELDALLNRFTSAPGLPGMVNEEARRKGFYQIVMHGLQVWPMIKAPEAVNSGATISLSEVADRLGIKP
jgi:hypothetical protein